MTITDGSTIKCSIVWEAPGQTFVNVHYLAVEDIVAQTQAQIRADIEEFFEGAYSFMVPHISSGVDHARTEIFNVGANAPEEPLGSNGNMDGTNAGETLPAQVAAYCFYRTGASRHIGKTFLPPCGEGDNVSGGMSATIRAALGNFAGAIAASDTMTNGVTLTKLIWDLSAGIGRAITDVEVPIHFRTQRRRRVGVGS